MDSLIAAMLEVAPTWFMWMVIYLQLTTISRTLERILKEMRNE